VIAFPPPVRIRSIEARSKPLNALPTRQTTQAISPVMASGMSVSPRTAANTPTANSTTTHPRTALGINSLLSGQVSRTGPGIPKPLPFPETMPAGASPSVLPADAVALRRAFALAGPKRPTGQDEQDGDHDQRFHWVSLLFL
jgi:hypothetical protein